MKKAFLFFLPALFAIACSKNELQLPQKEESAESSTTIPLPTALSKLDSMLAQLDRQTKSTTTRTYSIVSVIGGQQLSPTTKSTQENIPDTLMYLVNFDNQQGFAVLAADTRLGEDVYCVTEEGEIAPDDFARAYDFIHLNVSQTKADEDGFTDMGKDFVPALLLRTMLADLEYGPVVDTLTKSTPVVPTAVALLNTKWTQDPPFNRYTPHNYAPGCVAIACAQIMNYCKKPSNPVFDGVNCSWERMDSVYNCVSSKSDSASEVAKDQCGHFLHHIGKKSLLYIRYNSDGSWGMADGVVRTLKNYGYSSVNKYLGFGATNQSKVSSMLRQSLPVYLDASDHKRNTGHAWVVDGEWNGYFHCNWGWGGEWNGFYAKHNYFPISSRSYLDSKDDENDTPDDSSFKNLDFDWNFRLVTYSK